MIWFHFSKFSKFSRSAPTMVAPRGIGPPKFTKLPTPLLRVDLSFKISWYSFHCVFRVLHMYNTYMCKIWQSDVCILWMTQENCVVIAIASKISYRIEFILVTNHLLLYRFHGKRRYIHSCFFLSDILRGGRYPQGRVNARGAKSLGISPWGGRNL